MKINTQVVEVKRHYVELTNQEVLVLMNALFISQDASPDDPCWKAKDTDTGETQGDTGERLREAFSGAYYER